MLLKFDKFLTCQKQIYATNTMANDEKYMHRERRENLGSNLNLKTQPTMLPINDR